VPAALAASVQRKRINQRPERIPLLALPGLFLHNAKRKRRREPDAADHQSRMVIAGNMGDSYLYTMNTTAIREQIEVIRKATKKAMRSKKTARRFLLDAGIIVKKDKANRKATNKV